MKNKNFILPLLASISLLAAGCNTEHPTSYVNDPAIYFDNYTGLNFAQPIPIDSTTVSFMDIPEEEYTVTVRVLTQGMLDFGRDRYFTVRQSTAAPDDKNFKAAVAGVDYVSLDDDTVKGELFIPAGERYGYIPVTILKSDNVVSNRIELTLELAANDEFRLGMKDKLIFKIKYSAKPEQPINWAKYWYTAFGASWGPEKHKFIIKTLGTIDWTDETYPLAVHTYWKGYMKTALETYNLANPDAKLREADEDGGEYVNFN